MTFDQRLNEAKTMREIFRTVNMFYDTDAPLPYMVQLLVKSNVKRIVTELKIQRRAYPINSH